MAGLLLTACGATGPGAGKGAPDGDAERARDLDGLRVVDPPRLEPLSAEAAAATKSRGDAAFVDGKLIYRGTTAGLVITELDGDKLLERAVVYLPGAGNDVLVHRQVAYVACGSTGVVAVDVSSITEPEPVAAVDTPGSALRLELAGDLLLVADGATGVAVLDVSVPWRPRPVAAWRSEGYVRHAIAVGDVVYAAEGRSGVSALRLAGDGSLEHLWRVDTGGQARAISGDKSDVTLLFVADGPQGLLFLGLSSAGVVEARHRLELEDMARDVAVGEKRAYVATGDDGVIIVDIDLSGKRMLVKSGEFVPDKPTNRLRIVDDKLYVGNDSDGLLVLDISDPDQPQKVFPPDKEQK
jgi:hypothetical protein